MLERETDDVIECLQELTPAIGQQREKMIRRGR